MIPVYHTIKLTTAGKKFWRTKKTTMRLVETDRAVSLDNGYWDGGTRDEYYAQRSSGQTSPLTYPTAPPQFGGGLVPAVMPQADVAIIATGIFRGEQKGITAYVLKASDWMLPQYGTEVIKI